MTNPQYEEWYAMEKLICLLNIEHMLLLKLDVNPSSLKLRDAGMLEITPRYSSKKTFCFFLWEEKNPYKSDDGSLILDDTKPPKTLW